MISDDFSTSELCATLGVSRGWVNKYLRHLGKMDGQRQDRANIRTVFYSENDVVDYLNKNAEFTHQTEFLDLRDYEEEEKLLSAFAEIKKLPEKNQEKAYWMLVDQVLPQNIVIVTRPMICARTRGDTEWRTVKKVKIESLDQLYTIARLTSTSTELAYRAIYANGWIRVRVHGRSWFMPGRPKTKTSVLTEAQ